MVFLTRSFQIQKKNAQNVNNGKQTTLSAHQPTNQPSDASHTISVEKFVTMKESKGEKTKLKYPMRNIHAQSLLLKFRMASRCYGAHKAVIIQKKCQNERETR